MNCLNGDYLELVASKLLHATWPFNGPRFTVRFCFFAEDGDETVNRTKLPCITFP